MDFHVNTDDDDIYYQQPMYRQVGTMVLLAD